MSDKLVMEAIIKARDQVSSPLRKIMKNFIPLQMQLSSIARAGQGVSMSLKKMMGPLTIMGGAGLAGLSASLKNVANYGDSIGNISERIGWTTDALQEYIHVAKNSDMSSEEFTASLEVMNKQMGQLRAGTGPLVSGLKGIAPVVLNQIKAAKSNEEAFDLMIKAIQKVEDPVKKAHLATTFFGQSGKKMVLLANKGAEGIEELRKEAHKLGLVLDEEAIKNSGLFNKAMDDVKNSLLGITRTVGAAFLPAVIKILENLKEWVALNKDLIVARLSSFLKGVTTAVTTLYKAGRTLVKVLGGVDNIFYIWATVRIISIIASVGTLIKTIWGLGSALKTSIAAWKTMGIMTSIANLGLVKLAITCKTKLGSALLWTSNAVKSVAVYLGKMLWAGIVKVSGAVVIGTKAIAGFAFALGKALLFSVVAATKAVIGFSIALLACPITWIVAGIAAIAGAAYLIYKNWEPIKQFFSDLWDGVVEAFDSALDAIRPIVDAIGSVLSPIIDAIKFVINAPGKVISWISKKLGFSDDSEEEKSVDKATHGSFYERGAGETSSYDGSVSPMVAGSGRTDRSKAEVTVKFDNMPRGASVNSDASGQGMDLGVETGYAMPAAVR